MGNMKIKYLQLKNWKKILQHLGIALVILVIAGYGTLKILDYCYPFPTAMLDKLKAQRASSIVLDKNGKILRPFLSIQDNWLLWNDNPKRYKLLSQAFIAAEDRRFYQHHGIDYLATGRAFLTNIFYMRRVSGASTLTMQLMRMAMQHHQRTLSNKIVELFRAWQCEQLYSKDAIMNYYLNLAPFGSNIYGVTAAAKIFFAKTPDELTVAEAALLAGLVQAPSRYLPYRHQRRALKRRNIVLYRMFKNHFITRQQWLLAYKTPVVAQRNALPFRSPHFAQLLAPQHGSKIVTTIDAEIQQLARYKLHSAVRVKGGINGAIIVVENRTGAVRAFIGSAGFKTSPQGEVNYATQRLNTGSLLKPFIYLQAFQRGLALPSTIINDQPRQFANYTPRNFDQQWHGQVTVREALAYSYNIPAVTMLQKVGITNFVDFMLDLDCAPLPHTQEYYGLSMALGSVPYSLLDITHAYVTLARLGNKIPLHYIGLRQHSEDSTANVLHRISMNNQSFSKKQVKAVNSNKSLKSTNNNNAPFGVQRTQTTSQTMDSSAAYLICDILKDQTRLAGRRLAVDSSKQVNFAWKTGTSNQYREAWTVAWNPQWTVGVMLTANLPNSKAKLIGIQDAAPLATTIITAISTNNNCWYPKPANVITREICSVTGLVPNGNCSHRIKALSIAGRTMTKYCQCQKKRAQTIVQVPEKTGRFIIKQPINNTTYLTTGSNKKIICMATTSIKQDKLFWFADGNFIGQTKSGNSISYKFNVGSHRLTCSTNTGQQSSVNFVIKH
jgi:penicillin-binding protein 1C